MNIATKKLLLEILSFLRTNEVKESDIYIKKPLDKLRNDLFRTRSYDLIGWIDPVHHLKNTDLEKYVYYDDESMTEDIIQNIYNEFVLLFKYLPELKEIFVLKEKYIEFNPSLSKNDIKEIYQLVLDFYKVHPRKATFLKKPYEK
jgi:hypothetical protein